MTQTRDQYVGQLQQHGQAPVDVQFFASKRPNLSDKEQAASVQWVDGRYPEGDIRRYGALVDGTTDDTEALQIAGDTGHPVYVPDGTAVIDACSWTVAVDITIAPGGVLLHKATSTDHMLQSTVGLTVRGGQVNGNRSNRTWDDDQLPVFADSGYVGLFKVHFTATLHAAFRVGGTASRLRVEGCEFDDMEEHPGTGTNSTLAGVIRPDDGEEMVVWLLNNEVSHGTPSVAGRGPGGFLWDGGSATGGTGIKRVIAKGNHFTNIGQNASTNFIGCLHGYTNGGEFIGGANEFKNSYWVAILLQNATSVSLGRFLVTEHVAGINAVQVQTARDYTGGMADIDLGRGVIKYESGATTGIGLVVLGDADDYIYRVVGGPFVITEGANGIRFQYVAEVSLTCPHVEGCNGQGIQIQNTSDGADAPTNAKYDITGGQVNNCGGIGIASAASNVDNLHLNIGSMQFEANTTNHIRTDSASRTTVVGCNFVDDLSQVIRAQNNDSVTIGICTGTTTATTSTTGTTNVLETGNNF